MQPCGAPRAFCSSSSVVAASSPVGHVHSTRITRSGAAALLLQAAPMQASVGMMDTHHAVKRTRLSAKAASKELPAARVVLLPREIIATHGVAGKNATKTTDEIAG